MWQMLTVLVHRYTHLAACFCLTLLLAPSHCESTRSPCQQQDLLQPSLGGEPAAAADKAKPAAVNITATPTIPSSSDKPRAPAQSSNTRARRLSYVTNDVSASHCTISKSLISVSEQSFVPNTNSASHMAPA